MIYLISNSKFLTQKIIDDLNIQDNDKIILFNKAESLPFFNGKKISLVQRWSGTIYHGSNLVNNLNIDEFYLYGRGDAKYITSIRKKDPNRKLKIIDPIDDIGKLCFNETRFSPFLGTLMLIYFDNIYPNEKKVLVGFTSYYQEKVLFIQKNSNGINHDNNIDRKVVLDYCYGNENIIFKYCCLKNDNNIKELVDVDPLENYKPTKQYGKINIEK